MLKFLNHKLDDITEIRFRRIAPLVSFISDISLAYYMKTVLVKDFLNETTLYRMLRIQGINPSLVPKEDLDAVMNMMDSSVSLGLGLVLSINFIIYMFCLKNKFWAKKYIRNYAFFGAILTIFEIIGVIYSGRSLNMITPATMVSYFFVYYGYRYFMKKEE